MSGYGGAALVVRLQAEHVLVVAARAGQVQAPAARGAAAQQRLGVQLQREGAVAVRLGLLKAQHLARRRASQLRAKASAPPTACLCIPWFAACAPQPMAVTPPGPLQHGTPHRQTLDPLPKNAVTLQPQRAAEQHASRVRHSAACSCLHAACAHLEVAQRAVGEVHRAGRIGGRSARVRLRAASAAQFCSQATGGAGPARGASASRPVAEQAPSGVGA